MQAFKWFVVVAVLLTGAGWTQAVPTPPANPINFFLRSLESEAKLNVTGSLTEHQVFPPRKETDQTRTDFPAPPPILPMLLRQNWRVTVTTGEAIAGRETWRLNFMPRNTSAPQFSLWIDREWNVRLGFQETDSLGAVTYSVRYTTVEKPSKRQNIRKLTRLEPKPKLEEFVRKQIGGYYLPNGFRLFDVRPRVVKDNQNALELRASNGLSVIVVVFAPISTGKSPKLAVRDLKGSWVWVIGNVEKNELERIATSIRAPLEIGNLLSGFSGAPR
jgi:hypothetical protein